MTKKGISREQWRQRNRNWIKGVKESNPCADCLQYFPSYVMQFDHVRGVKSFTIGACSRFTKGRAKIEAEMAKCDIVCANCHMERTHGSRNHDVLGLLRLT